MDAMFDTLRGTVSPRCSSWARERVPEGAGRLRLRLQADASRPRRATRRAGILPAATLSNVGIYGTGQAYEALLLRMRAHPLPEAPQYAAMMLEELRKVIPSFLTRVDRPDRGVAWSAYLAETRTETAALVARLFAGDEPEPRPAVMLTDFDPDGEDKLLAAICYPHTALPEDQILERVRRLAADERVALLTAYVGERDEPAAQAGPGLRAHRLPLRRARRLRRVP